MFALIFIVFVIDYTLAGETKDKFMLIPSIGYEIDNKSGTFMCILNGWYYEPLTSNLLQATIKASFLIALQHLDQSGTYENPNLERLEPFFVKDVKDHKIELKFSKSISESISTDDNGRFHTEILINSLEGLNIKGNILKYIALDDEFNKEGDEGKIYLMKNEAHHGCSIISDIDDTIKISEVPDKKKLIINTFKKDFKAVPGKYSTYLTLGMSDIYRSWQSSHKCLVHYVSAMPSQLYYVTQQFLNKEKFPGGSFHMRHLKLVSPDTVDLITQILAFAHHNASRIHKLLVIKNILDHAPKNQEFIMVGDSGELDPEIYGEIASKYSNRIKMIFIRRVEGGNNDDTRFEEAFKNIPDDKWNTFSDSNELPQKLYDDEYDNLNHGIILSISMIPILLTLLFTIVYV